MLHRFVHRRLAPLALAIAALAGAAHAHIVSPTSITLRPGGEDYFFVVDGGTCPATIKATTSDSSIVQVLAVDMNNGNPLPGNGVSVVVSNRVDQVFVLRANAQLTAPASATITVCWIGANYPSGPCNENNCPAGVPVSVTVDPLALTSGSTYASASARDPVNTNTGEFIQPEPLDFDLGGPLPLTFGRYYASRLVSEGLAPGTLGPNWLHNFDWRLSASASTVEINSSSGRLIRFERPYLGTGWDLASVLDVPYQLVDQGGGFQLADPTSEQIYSFNGSGRLDAVADRNGNTHSLSYTSGRIASVSDGLGRMLSFSYNGSGLLAGVSDGMRTASFAYDGNGSLASATNVDGKATTYAYDGTQPAAALLIARTLPKGNTPYVQAFNGSGQVVSQTDAFGNPWGFSYGGSGSATTVTDPLTGAMDYTHGSTAGLSSVVYRGGGSATFKVDAQGRRQSITDALGVKTSWTWHLGSGRLSTRTDANGGKTTYSYQTSMIGGLDFHDLIRIKRADGSEVNRTVDAAGNVLARQDESGNTWTNTYNGRGQILTSTNPAGGTTTLTYNADGTPATLRDHAGEVTSITYDALRHPIQITRPDATFESYTYSVLDRLLSATNELGQTRSWGFDDNGNASSYTSAVGSTWTVSHDAMDRVSGAVDPFGNPCTSTFDVLGRVETTTNELGFSRTFGYDLDGRLTGVQDELGRLWSQGYDLEGVIAAKSSPSGLVTTYGSDSQGRNTSITSPLGHQVRTSYGSNGRVSSLRDALGRSSTFTWGNSNRLDRATMGSTSVSATYTYDSLGGVATATLPGNRTWSFGINAAGQRTSETDPLGNSTTYQYGGRGRLSMMMLPGIPGSLSFQYDDVGNLTRRLYPDGTDLMFGYDPDGRVLSANGFSATYDLGGNLSSSNGQAVTHNARGFLESLTLDVGKTVNYGWTPTGRLASVTDWVGGQTTFSYDNDDRLTSMMRPNMAETRYAWDADGRLTGVTHDDPNGSGVLADHQLTLDAVGQVTSATNVLPTMGAPALGTLSHTYDAACQVEGFGYDGLGRLLDDGMRAYTWDDASRLGGYTESGSTTTFGYDGFGLRTSRTAGGATLDYTWNRALGRPSVTALSRAGQPVRFFVPTPSGTPLHSVEAVGDERYYYHYDPSGSTTLLSDDAASIVNAYQYGPFGATLAETVVRPNPFTFHGALGVMREGSSGLYYMRGRYYDSVTGRFISRDPVETLTPLEGNPYQFAFNNPLRFADPLGLRGESLDSSSPVTVFSGADLRASGVVNAADVLRSIPTGTSAPITQHGLRGVGNSTATLVLVEGRRARGFTGLPALPRRLQSGDSPYGPGPAWGWRNYRRTIEKFRARRGEIIRRHNETFARESFDLGYFAPESSYGSLGISSGWLKAHPALELQGAWDWTSHDRYRPSAGTSILGKFDPFTPKSAFSGAATQPAAQDEVRFFRGVLDSFERSPGAADTQGSDVKPYLQVLITPHLVGGS